jgi:single-strand DNA-binding protein
MAGSVNRVILVGNLGQDPDVVKGREGSNIVKLSIATSESWRDKATGERKEVTDWHRVTIFDKTAAEFAEKYLKKGMKVYVEGKQKTRKYTDQAGVEKYSTEVVLQAFDGKLENLTKREGSGGAPSEDDYGTPSGGSRPSGSAAPGDDMDEQIPF